MLLGVSASKINMHLADETSKESAVKHLVASILKAGNYWEDGVTSCRN